VPADKAFTSADINTSIRKNISEGRDTITINALRGHHCIAVGLPPDVKLTVKSGDAGDFFGALNEGAELLMNGPCGRFLASTMSDGLVVVNGDAKGDVAPYLSGGVVVVKGDCQGSAGGFMKGGTVIIDGDVSGDVGYMMLGGVIIVTGDVDGVVGEDMKDGTIYIGGHFSRVDTHLKKESLSKYDADLLESHYSKWRFRRFSTAADLESFIKVRT